MAMDELADLQRNGHWRLAVWALRLGYLALTIALAGLIVLISGGTPWLLAVGVIVWLGVAVVTVTAVLLARRELPGPRPGLWPLRLMLVRDSVHARSST